MTKKEIIERAHRFEDNQLVLIRKQTGENGTGKKVTVTSEEFGIDAKEVQEVLDKHVPERMDATMTKLETAEKQLESIELQTSKFENTKEFKAFKTFLEDNANRFDEVKLISDRDRVIKEIAHLKEQVADIEDWRQQMSAIEF